MPTPEGEVTPTSDRMAHSLLLGAAPSSVAPPKTPGWTLCRPALVRYQWTPVMLVMLVDRSRHLQRLTHPKAQGWVSLWRGCFSPLTREEVLKFQNTQNR